jgi:cytochrome c oxidase subunit II
MDKFQLFPDQASAMSPRVDTLFLYLCAITVFFTVMIFALVLIFAVKYRRRSEDERPHEIHPSKILEVVWIVIPLVLVMVMFAWGAALYVSNNRPPANAMEINVVGKQWMWKIQHPDGQREIDELHVPTGKPVRLVMTSQDVIHDFFIPAFRVKMDVVPGKYTSEWFEATKKGEYHIFCSQYCGTLHAQMIGKVVVMDPADYQAWLAGSINGDTPAMAGQKLFQQYSCVNCHSQQAPTMANLYGSDVKVYEDGVLKTVKADEDYLRESILQPNKKIVQGYQPLMPNFEGTLTEEQIFDLIAYIKTLGHQGGAVDTLKMNNRIVPMSPATPDLGNGHGLMGPLVK